MVVPSSLSVSEDHMKLMDAWEKTDQHLLSRGLHSTQIFFWQFIISNLPSGELTWKILKSPFSNLLQHTVHVTHVVLSHQLDQVLYSLQKQTALMCGTSLINQTSQVWPSTPPRVHSCTADSNTTNTLAISSIWLSETNLTVPAHFTKFHQIWKTFKKTRKRTSHYSGKEKSKSAFSYYNKEKQRRKSIIILRLKSRSRKLLPMLWRTLVRMPRCRWNLIRKRCSRSFSWSTKLKTIWLAMMNCRLCKLRRRRNDRSSYFKYYYNWPIIREAQLFLL